MNEVKRGTLHEIKPVIRIFRLRFHLSPPSFLSGVSDRSTKINVFEPASFLANGLSVNTYGLLKQTSHRQLGSPSTCLISSSIVFHLGSCADAYGFNLQTVFVHVEALFAIKLFNERAGALGNRATERSRINLDGQSARTALSVDVSTSHSG
jgi:hypothetical protein